MIGNKCDYIDRRSVSPEQGQRLTEELGIPFIEVSAKGNINIEKSFYTLASDIKKAMESSRGKQNSTPYINIDQQAKGLGFSSRGKYY